MKEYFIIRYKNKNEEEKEMKVEADALVVNIVILRREECKITDVTDNFNDHQDLVEMLDIFSESIDVEYEDVKTKEEAYELAFKYFDDLFNNEKISKKWRDEFINQLDQYKETVKNKRDFIFKVKDLYVL